MLEDGGRIDQGKLEGTPEGKAPGQISLDQARTLALEHARDNTDFYGRRYATQDLVWEVLSQKERRDYYDIRLAYRPAEGYRGKPGVERFTFDKWGAVRLRSVLEAPAEQKTLLVPRIVAATIMFVAAAVGILFAAGVFSLETEAVPLATVSISLAPETASELVSPQGEVTVTLEAGSVAEEVQLSYQPLSTEMTPNLPPGYAVGSIAFELSVKGVGDQTLGSYTFTKLIAISIRLNAGELLIAGEDESRLVIQHYHESESVWEPLPTTVDFSAAIATAQVDRLSIFALTIKQAPPAPTQVPTQAATPAPAP